MKALTLILVSVLALSLTGCAGMTDEQQRMLSGGAIGAGGGAVLAAAAGGSVLLGAALGGAAGVVGGVLVNQQQKQKGEAQVSKDGKATKAAAKTKKAKDRKEVALVE